MSHPPPFIFNGRILFVTHMVNFLLPAEIHNAGQSGKFDVPKVAMYRSFCPKPQLQYIERWLYIIENKRTCHYLKFWVTSRSLTSPQILLQIKKKSLLGTNSRWNYKRFFLISFMEMKSNGSCVEWSVTRDI